MGHTRARVTTAYRLTPRNCRSCGRFMDEEFLKARLKEVQAKKAQKMRDSFVERRAAGEQIGAVRKRNNAEILRLRAQGLSIRAIARQLGCSVSPVSDALKGVK